MHIVEGQVFLKLHYSPSSTELCIFLGYKIKDS